MEIVHSEYVSPCSPVVLKRWGHLVRQDVGGKHEDAFRHENVVSEGVRQMESRAVARRASLDLSAGVAYSPTRRSTLHETACSNADSTAEVGVREGANRCKFQGLFEGFPRTLIVVGDAERLVREIRSLQDAMEKDGVDVQGEWVKDAVHDMLMMGQSWCDWDVIEGVWEVVENWVMSGTVK